MATERPTLTITNDQLVGLVAECIKRTTAANATDHSTALATALQGLNLGQGTVGGSAKDIKFGAIHSFDGKTEDFQPFLQECFVRFELQPNIYNTPAIKAAFMLSYFTKGSARLWKEAYYAERAGKPFVANNNFDAFIDHLKDSFTDTGRVQDALYALQTLKQGKKAVDELNTVFRTYMQKAGLTETANRVVLINYYQQALNPKMVAEIILKGTAQTLDEWMTVATQLDAAQRMINHFQNPIAQRSQHHRKTFKPNFHYRSKTERYGESMRSSAPQCESTGRTRDCVSNAEDQDTWHESARPKDQRREPPNRRNSYEETPRGTDRPSQGQKPLAQKDKASHTHQRR
jgi:hypothetical protein